jgi:hypothetical protein
MEMKPNRLLRIAVPVAGALLLAAAAVVTASAAGLGVGSLFADPAPPSPGATAGKGSAVCQDFLGHLASQLGISGDKLDTAAIAAGKQTIQDQVAAGRITQAEADKIEAKLTAGNLCRLGAGGRYRAAGAIREYLSAAASALGVSDSELKGDLKAGQTLSQVAAAKGVSEDQFKSKVVAILKPKLDAAVSAGKLTQAQEDAVLAKLQKGDPPLWNSARKGGASPTPTPAA